METEPRQLPTLAGKWLQVAPHSLSSFSLRFEQEDQFRLSLDTAGTMVYEAWDGGGRNRPIPGLYQKKIDEEARKKFLEALAKASPDWSEGGPNRPMNFPSPIDPHFTLRILCLGDTVSTGWRNHSYPAALDSALPLLRSWRDMRTKDTLWSLRVEPVEAKVKGGRLQVQVVFHNRGKDPISFSIPSQKGAAGSTSTVPSEGITLNYSEFEPPVPGITPLPPEIRLAQGRPEAAGKLLIPPYSSRSQTLLFQLDTQAASRLKRGMKREGLLILKSRVLHGKLESPLTLASDPFSF